VDNQVTLSCFSPVNTHLEILQINYTKRPKKYEPSTQALHTTEGM